MKAVEQLREALADRGISFARPALAPNPTVFSQEVDRYLEALEEPKRSTLGQLRQTILEILPDAEETMSYGVPAFKIGGNTIAGFAAFNSACSIGCPVPKSVANESAAINSTNRKPSPSTDKTLPRLEFEGPTSIARPGNSRYSGGTDAR
jgi:hypothetical protein